MILNMYFERVFSQKAEVSLGGFELTVTRYDHVDVSDCRN